MGPESTSFPVSCAIWVPSSVSEERQGMSKQPHLLRREPRSRGGTSLSIGDKGDVLVVKE